MKAEIQVHETNVAVSTPSPAEVLAGRDMTIKVKVSCPHHCNLKGGEIKIVDGSGAVVKASARPALDGTAREPDEWVVRAPAEAGDYAWTAVFAGQEEGSVHHAESAAPFSFSVKPHPLLVEAWDVPSPLVFNAKFKVKIGARCSAGCNVTGSEFAVYDHDGIKVATGHLGAIPWATKSGQSGAEVELQAPGTEGRYMWEVKFPELDLELAHEASACTFSAGVAGKPEHTVTVLVVDSESRNPLKNANVILRPSIYRGSAYSNTTDESGVARVSVPKGEYHVGATSPGHKSFVKITEVAGELAVTAELVPGSDLDDIFG